jgi:bifunctional ADP-heptose synthase (sugar kinase/adenylyltransferase)
MAGNVVQNLKSISDCVVKLYSQKTEITKTRFVDDKSNHMFLRVDEGESNIDQFKLTDEIIKEVSEYDIVVVSDYDKGFLSSDDIIKIGKSSKLSIIDAKKKLNRQIIDSFTFVKLNESEWKNNEELVSGFENKLLITLGIRGCQWNDEIFQSVNPKVTMDVSGAGDTFTSAFILNYYLSKDIPLSIQFANKMASIVVSERGVQTP